MAAANLPGALPPVSTILSADTLLAANLPDQQDTDRNELRALGQMVGVTAPNGSLQGYSRVGDNNGHGIYVPSRYVPPPLVFNGGFEIWQEGTSFTSAADGQWTADGFRYNKVGAMVHDISRSTFAPAIVAPHGLVNYSVLIDCTTVDSSIAAGDYATFEHRAEGWLWLPYAQREWSKGFWHAHTKTGTYCVALVNSGGDRSCVATYTQAVADSWEYSVVTWPASPSAGTWDYTTGLGVRVVWSLACGSTFQTNAGAWQTGLFYATSAQVNACDNTANNFRLTGIQPAFGAVAQPYVPMPLRQLEALAQRYVYKNIPLNTAPFTTTTAVPQIVAWRASSTVASNEYYASIDLPQEMRAAPTVTTWPYTTATNTGRASDGGGADYAANSAVSSAPTAKRIAINNQSGGTLTVSANGLIHVGVIARARP